MHWQEVAVGYVSYLAVVSMARREFASARPFLFIAAAMAWGAQATFVVFGRPALSPALEVVLPSLVLLTGYWLSGLLFVRPDPRIERWLLSVDERVLTRPGVLSWFQQAPRLVTEYFELTYLLVYLAVPAGAVTLALGGHTDQIDRFWTVVLLAEFACYGMLPWIQTRPPRVFDTQVGTGPQHAHTAFQSRDRQSRQHPGEYGAERTCRRSTRDGDCGRRDDAHGRGCISGPGGLHRRRDCARALSLRDRHSVGRDRRPRRLVSGEWLVVN